MRRLTPLLLLALAGCPEDPKPPPVVAPPAAPTPVARLVEARGTVLLTRDGGTGPTSVPNNLFAGDVLETKRGSRALLRSGRLEVELDEDTIFPLGKALKDITVTTGDVFLSSDDGGADFATALGKGSLSGRVRLAARDGGLAFDVGFGELLLEDEDGGTTTAKQGQRMKVGFGALQLEEVTDPAERLRLGLGAVEMEDDAPPPVKATVEAGAPLLKKPGALRPSPAPKSSTVEAGTGFQTPGTSALKFEAEGVTLRVTGGGGGELGEPKRLGTSTLLPVTLEKGGGALKLTGGTLKLGGPKPVSLSSAESAANVSGAKGARRVEVVVGTVTLKDAAGKETAVPAGQVATISPEGEVDVKPLARPALVVPYGRKAVVYSLALKDLGLRLPNNKVRVEVATDNAFATPLFVGEAEDLVIVPVPAGKQLFWRFPDDKGGTTLGQVRLRPEPASSKGGVRGDVIAETGLKASVYYQGHSPPLLTLTFAAVPEAKGYHLKVYAQGKLTTPVFEKRTDTNKALIESGALTEGSYVWFAAPVDANGRELAGGRMNQMELVFDNTLTTLVIKSPRDGARAGADVVAAGTAPQGSKLSINGKPAALEGNGHFSVSLGKVDTVVFLLSTDGADSYWIRKLKR